MANDKPVILFDGVCNLCNKSVQFVLKRDSGNKFLFASLQSEYGLAILERYNLSAKDFKTFILYQNENLYFRSDGVLKVLVQLKGYQWTKFFYVIPKFIRDFLYNWIAKNRYRWFGKREECWMPTPELQKRFLG